MKKKDKKKKDSFSLEESYLAELNRETDLGQFDIPNDIQAILSDEEQNDASLEKLKERDPGRLKVIISPDKMWVSLRAEKCPAFTAEQILKQIIGEGVIFGIDKSAVSQAALLLKESGGWPDDLIVARGREPFSPSSISYSFLTKTDGTAEQEKWLADGVELPYAEVRIFLESDNISSLSPEILLVKAVAFGETLAVLEGEMTEKSGKDVMGEDVDAGGLYLKAGENVRFNHEKNIYQAMIYGYLCVADNEIAILPPLWISPDKMSAYYINLPQISEPKYPSVTNLSTVLTLAGVTKNVVHREILDQLSRKLASGKDSPFSVRVASGLNPKQGADAQFRLFIDSEIKAGEIRHDDSIDLRERNIVQSVRKGQLLAEKIKAEKGVPGLTLLGEKIKASDGNDIKIQADKGVIAKENEEKILFYAKHDGNVYVEENVLSVVDVFHITGDVDYSTGNIDVNSDLEIGGSIKPGFSVRAEGNIIVHGTVEYGASIFANGNLSVEQGIIGELTKVIVLGGLKTDFIQDAEVMVKGDVKIKSYLFNSRLRSAGTIQVLKLPGSKGGKVIGGVVCAAEGLEISTVGSSSNQNTLVAIQVAPEIKNKFSQLEEQLKLSSEKIVKLMRTLNLQSTNPDNIRDLLSKLPPEKKEIFLNILCNLNGFIKYRNSLKDKRNRVREDIDLLLAKGKIKIFNRFYMGNKVQIGDRKFMAQADMGATVFRLDGDVIICQ